MTHPKDGERQTAQDLSEVLHLERSTMLRIVASSFAHAVGTPIQVISGRATMANDAASPEELRQQTDIIRRKCDELARTVQSLVGYAREQVPTAEPSELGDVLLGVVRDIEPTADAASVEIRLGDPPPVPAEIVKASFAQAVRCLVLGGIDMCREVVGVALTEEQCSPPPTAAGLAQPGRFAHVEIVWRGVGLEAKTHAELREPWLHEPFASRSAALSLAVASGLVRENGGWLSAAPSAGGATFDMFWPLTR